MGALVLRKSGIGVPEGRSVFRLKWERISKGALFFRLRGAYWPE